MTMYKFECGCEIKLIDSAIKEEDGLPSLNIDYYNLNHDCPLAWQVFHEGDTQGIWQLEKSLGQTWSKKIKPSTIEEIAALGALLRPGCLRSKIDGKSMTQRYTDRKNNEEENIPLHPSLGSLLDETHNVLCVEENTFVSQYNGQETKIKNLSPLTEIESVKDGFSTKAICNNVVKSRLEIGYELILENGYRVILTKDHKVFTNRGMIELQFLDKNKDVVGVLNNQTRQCQNTILSDWLGSNNIVAYFWGQLLGDGNRGENIAVGSLEKAKKLQKWININIPILKTKIRHHTRCWYIDISCDDLLLNKEYGNRKTKYRYIIEQYGLDLTKTNKVIPSIIFESNIETISAFLAGLFDSDGHSGITKNGYSVLSYCSGTKEIINGIRKLLNILGIKNYIDNNYNHIYINDKNKFKSVIGKYLVLNKIDGKITSGNTYGAYPTHLVKHFIKNKYGNIALGCRLKQMSTQLLRNQYKFMHHKNAVLFGAIDNNDITYMRIKQINNVGIKQFYSISVDITHNFIGNGIILGNCYQEQSMAIASYLANFDLKQADTLRKAIGKKKADIMAKAKKEFIDGCKIAGIVNENDAEIIFSAIESSNRYAFNKSHAVEYGEVSYWTAWTKAHFPIHFFCAYLNFAKEKMKPKEEIECLIDDARIHNISIYPPRLDTENFTISKHGIYFGLNNVKGIGTNGLSNIINVVNTVKLLLNKEPPEWSWFEILSLVANNISRTIVNNIISIGVLSNTGLSRNQMLQEYNIWSNLTDREKAFILSNKCNNLLYGLNNVLNITSKKRTEIIKGYISSIQNPMYSVEDDIRWIVNTEKNILGVPLTYSKLDTCKITGGNTTCQEFIDGKNGDMHIAVEIVRFSEYIIKSGKNEGRKMGYLTLKDASNKIDAVIYSDQLQEFENICYYGNTVIVSGNRDKKNSFIIKKMAQI